VSFEFDDAQDYLRGVWGTAFSSRMYPFTTTSLPAVVGSTLKVLSARASWFAVFGLPVFNSGHGRCPSPLAR
jgi:hypothetical protein